MSIERERLIWLALCTVDKERRGVLRNGRMPPTFGLRLALAYLCANGKSGDRSRYDQLWRCITAPTGEEHELYHASQHLKWIIDDVGIAEVNKCFDALWDAVEPKPEGVNPLLRR